ncbi:MAG: carboxypeptidase regulatory-like domain-containing protein [Candidatus Solibacter usitatus]|nr:carboxypeptidase regulatory-like domain-containing protein [Candidatus Solibacter usitatus]
MLRHTGFHRPTRGRAQFALCYGLGLSLACSAAPPGASLQGSVVNTSSGESVPSATVQLLSNGAVAREAEADSHGRFVLENLPAGQYIVRAEMTGYVDMAPFWNGSRKIQLTAGKLATLQLRLTRTAVVTGRVYGTTGEPLRGVKVTAIGRRRDGAAVRFLLQGAPVFTDDRGIYRIHGLAPGAYSVAAVPDESDAQGMAFSPVYYPGNHDPARAEFFEVKEGETRNNADLALTSTSTIDIGGSVRDIPADWQPGHVAVALLTTASPALPVSVTVAEADGRYVFRGIPPGPYQVVAWGPIVAWGNRGPMPGPGGRKGEAFVEAGTGGQSGMNVSLHESAVVEVSISTQAQSQKTDDCLAAARVVIVPLYPLPDVRQLKAPLSAQGYTLREVPRGLYRVEVEGLRDACYVKEVLDGEQHLEPERVEITGNAKLSLVLTTAVGSVSGNVETPDQRLAGGALVLLIPSAIASGAGRATRVSAAGETGRYEFSGVPPGDYWLLTTQTLTSNSYLDPEFRAGKKEWPVRIQAGKSITVDLRLSQ